MNNNDNSVKVHRASTQTRTSEQRAPTFEYIPHDQLLSLFQQKKGTQYFIPEGFEPVLIPSGTQREVVQAVALPTTSQSSLSSSQSSASDVPRFPSLVLTRPQGPAPRGGSNTAKTTKPKKPPRPPNAFILYRRSKQPQIVAANEGISNNEVSKQIGEMWHKEPLEEKLKYQRLADEAKMEHMKKYPEYKYRPRRPHEKRRRTKRTPAPTTDNNTTTTNNDSSATRRASIDTVATVDSTEYDSRRGSLASIDETMAMFDMEPIFETAPVAVSTSESPEYVCVETAFDIGNLSMVEGVTPESEMIAAYEYFDFGYNGSQPNEFGYYGFDESDFGLFPSVNEHLLSEQLPLATYDS
ncbi:2997_t:CDS:2 [Paraglomus occultum]|uniref:2997_t:CDS:1 n=1 Tax=Paraglomus occultum TaxID=144539 RepID=A0A9N9FWZ7_9GLOM|nr:2997_t:CDS:2 [Paraglomus occultum]